MTPPRLTREELEEWRRELSQPYTNSFEAEWGLRVIATLLRAWDAIEVALADPRGPYTEEALRAALPPPVVPTPTDARPCDACAGKGGKYLTPNGWAPGACPLCGSEPLPPTDAGESEEGS